MWLVDRDLHESSVVAEEGYVEGTANGMCVALTNAKETPSLCSRLWHAHKALIYG